MARWTIPRPVPIDWEMRPVTSAAITAGALDDGRFNQVVRHAPLPGVTPPMCLWLLEHLGDVVTWRGHTVLAYRLWHPVDHISFERLGTFGVGDRWHIVEAFGADRRFLLDQHFHVTKLDETGFSMVIRHLGRTFVEVDERWAESDEGLSWTVDMTVGATGPGLRALSAVVLRRRMPFLLRWRQHNVEEVGNLPHFLPELDRAHQAEQA